MEEIQFAEAYFKKNNGYIDYDEKGYERYQACHITPDLEEKWRQELIQKHIKNLFVGENEIWIRLSILVDLFYQSSSDNTKAYQVIIAHMERMTGLPFWHKLFIMKVMVEGDQCLLMLFKQVPELYSRAIKAFESMINVNIEKEHENFVERYKNLYARYQQIM